MSHNPKASNPTREPTRSVRLELPLTAHRQLRIVAAREGLPMAALARRLVLEYLERQKRA